MTQISPLSYRDAGVDIDAGDALVDRIKALARKTMREGVLGGIARTNCLYGGDHAGRCGDRFKPGQGGPPSVRTF